MSSAEFAEWQAFDRLEPVGGPHLDRLFQRLAWVVFNSARMGSQHKVDPMKLEDFEFKWWETEDEDADVVPGVDLETKTKGIFGMLG